MTAGDSSLWGELLSHRDERRDPRRGPSLPSLRPETAIPSVAAVSIAESFATLPMVAARFKDLGYKVKTTAVSGDMA